MARLVPKLNLLSHSATTTTTIINSATLTMAGINAGDSKLVFESSEEVKVAPTFDALGLKEDLLRGKLTQPLTVCKKIWQHA